MVLQYSEDDCAARLDVYRRQPCPEVVVVPSTIDTVSRYVLRLLTRHEGSSLKVNMLVKDRNTDGLLLNSVAASNLDALNMTYYGTKGEFNITYYGTQGDFICISHPLSCENEKSHHWSPVISHEPLIKLYWLYV
jgi:hypothetical protein